MVPLLCAACFSEPADAEGGDASTSTSADDSTSVTSTSTGATSMTSAETGTSASTTNGDTVTTNVDTGTSDASDASETGSECGPDRVPAPTIPAGWSGPHVLFAGDADLGLPDCPELLDASQPDAAFAGGHAFCGCTCAPRCNVTWTEPGGNSCSDGGGMVAISDGADSDCIPFLGPGWIGNPGTPGAIECDSTSIMPHADSLAWDTSFRVCESAAACVSVPESGIGPCLRHDGDEACEDPRFATKHLLASDGTIACGACGSCASGVVEACQAAEVHVYPSPSCGGVVDQAIDPESCSVDDTYSDAQMHVEAATCLDSPATVTPTGVVTFCCA